MKTRVALLLVIFFIAFLVADAFGFSFSTKSTKISEAAICTTLNRPLFRGLSDALTAGQISELQAFLKSQGFYTEAITGLFGESTESAVKKFQRRHAIVLFGIPSTTGYGATGPLTRAKIKSISCYVPPPARPAPPVVPPAATPPATPPAAVPPVEQPLVPPVEPIEPPPVVGPLVVTCRPSPSSTAINDGITWRSTIVSGPNTTHTYNWQGTDGLTGNSSNVPKTYSTVGTKSASVTVDGQTFNCTPNLTVTIEPPVVISWPLAGLTPEPLYATTNSGQAVVGTYAYLTERHRVFSSSDLNTSVNNAIANMARMPEGRRFFDSLASEAQHRAIAGDPLDKCKTVNAEGVEILTSHNCPWWDVGAAKTKEYFEDFADAFEAAGGAMDFLILDTERHFNSWSIQSDAHADAIENDPRFVTLRNELVSSYSFHVTPTDFHLRDSIVSGDNPPNGPAWGPFATPQPEAADNYLKWNDWNDDLTADYIEDAIYDPLKAKFSSLKGTDYQYRNHSQSNAVPDINGHRVSEHGNGAIVGTHQSASLYGALGNITTRDYLSPSGEIYPGTPFNAFRYDHNQMRAMRLSSGAPLTPWFASRSWGGDNAYHVYINNSDYYEENVLHAAMVSDEDDLFILWSIGGSSDDQAFNNALTEFNIAAGYNNRQPLTNDLADWEDGFVYTGTRVGGYKVWRFTPDMGNVQNISSFITSDGNLDGSEAVTFDVSGDTVNFPNAFIYTPSNPVSDFGAWVIQTGSAGNPRVSSADTNSDQDPLLAAVFESSALESFLNWVSNFFRTILDKIIELVR